MLEEERPLVDVRGEVGTGWAEPDEQCREGRRRGCRHQEVGARAKPDARSHQRMFPV